jgi:formate--tetrahydrofolate ligase
VVVCEPYTKGGEGAKDLADAVIEILDKENKQPQGVTYAYEVSSSIKEKIHAVASRVYGALNIIYTEEAEREIASFEYSQYAKLPVCIAKTQYSFSDNPRLLGSPSDFDFTVKSVRLNSGAGFFVVMSGEVMLMPGLGKESRYTKIKVSAEGEISGLL